MHDRPPFLVRVILRALSGVSLVVPARERDAWKREWEAEILHRWSAMSRRPDAGLSDQWRLARQASGSVSDAAWLRRQFTRDSEVVHDMRHSWRMVMRRPAPFLATAAILALGIGSTGAVMSLLDRLVVRALPYPEADRLVALYQENTAAGVVREEVAPGNYLDWRAQATTSFEGVAAVEPFSVDMFGGERPQVVYAMRVTDRFFDLLRVQPEMGRLFTAADFANGAPAVAVVSHEFWAQLGDGPAPGARAVTFDDQPHTIIGVLPKRADLNLFDGRDRRDVFIPKIFQDYEPGIRGAGWWAAFGRLKSGVTHEAAQAELDVISARIAAAEPLTNARTTARIEPLETNLMRTVRPALLLMLSAAVLVLLVACANVANLLLVRGVERKGEFGVRTALGASRGRLVRQLLTEGWFLALAGSALGIGVAWLTIRLAVWLAPVESRRISELTLDTSVVLFVLACGMAAACVFSAVPAWHLSRRPRELTAVRTTSGRPARRFRDGLVVAEVAVAVALAVTVGLLGRSFAKVLSVDPGFRSDRLAVVQVFAWDRHNTAPKLAAFFDNAFRELGAVPGVTRVGAVSAMPFIEANINMETTLTIEGRPALPAESSTAFITVATPEYFEVMNIPVVAGRLFDGRDRPQTEPVALVSQSLARRRWPGSDPVGSMVTVELRGRNIRARIAGVVGAVRHDGLELPARDELFVPLSQQPNGSLTFVLETAGDPGAVLEPAKAAIWRVDPLQTIYDAATVPQLLSTSMAPRRFALVLTSAYAAAALGLAALGVYAVLAAATRQRTREIGVRLALGAPPPAIRRDVLSHALKLGGAGLAIGLLASAGLAQLLRGHLFDVGTFDPLTLIFVSVVVLAVTLVAAYAPARRAMRVDPLMALKDT